MVVPMNALLQHRGHNLMGAGRSIAVQNFNEQACILGLGAFYTGMTRLGCRPSARSRVFGLVVAGIDVADPALARAQLRAAPRRSRTPARPGAQRPPLISCGAGAGAVGHEARRRAIPCSLAPHGNPGRTAMPATRKTIYDFSALSITGQRADLATPARQGAADRQHRQRLRLHAAVRRARELWEDYRDRGLVVSASRATSSARRTRAATTRSPRSAS